MAGIYSNYLDQEVFPGSDFQFDMQLIPLDLTGCSAHMTIKQLNAGADAGYTVNCTTQDIGTTSAGNFDLDVPGATTAAWVPGTYVYYVLVTFSDGEIEPLVGGILMVKEFPVP